MLIKIVKNQDCLEKEEKKEKKETNVRRRRVWHRTALESEALDPHDSQNVSGYFTRASTFETYQLQPRWAILYLFQRLQSSFPFYR